MNTKCKEKEIRIENQIKEFFESLSIALEEKDKYTRGHSKRVENYCSLICNKMNLTEHEKDIVTYSAKLHDIGKIAISENILNKPCALTKEEFEIIKTHPEVGARILEPIKGIDKNIINFVRYHHERYDGNGYFKKKNVCPLCHILIFSDSLDAMLSTRSYRSQKSLNYAINEIKRCSGSQFHPEIVDVFLKIVKEGCNPLFSELMIEN